MKNILVLTIKGTFVIILILLLLSTCQVRKDSENQVNTYREILTETVFEKLLYNPDIISNLSFIADGENNFNDGETSYNKDVTFYIRPEFLADTARYYITKEELYMSDYQTEIFLEHEGKRTNRLREFSSFEFDDTNFFEFLRSIQHNYILLNEKQSIDDLQLNGIIISFYKPDKTDNSVYQIVKMTNLSETINTMLTISFSLDKLELRSFSLNNNFE